MERERANVKQSQASTDAAIASAAAYAADQLKLGNNAPAAVATAEQIGTIGYDKTIEIAKKEKGDARLGQELFTKIGCVGCHTVSTSEGLEGSC